MAGDDREHFELSLNKTLLKLKRKRPRIQAERATDKVGKAALRKARLAGSLANWMREKPHVPVGCVNATK